MAGIDAPLELARCHRELCAGIHAEALGRVGRDEREHIAAGGATDLEHVGQVELALGVIAAHLHERLEERLRVEAVEPGVAFRDRGLGGVGVLLLDDALDAPVGVADDAPVAEGVVELHREHHHGRARLGAHARELADGFGRDERAVARQDEQRPVEVGKRVFAGENRIGRAALSGLDDHLGVGDERLDHFARMPHDRHDARSPRLARGVDDPADERLA